jgi:hypothetical protein
MPGLVPGIRAFIILFATRRGVDDRGKRPSLGEALHCF